MARKKEVGQPSEDWTEGLSESALRQLEHRWKENAEDLYPFEQWAREVRSIEVDLRPGGRAVLKAPPDTEFGYSIDFRVEVLWYVDQRDRWVEPWEARIIGEEPLGVLLMGFDFAPFLAALDLALDTGSSDFVNRVPRKRPKPGQPFDVDFYRRVLVAYKELILAGSPAPAVELGERMGENPSTVRSWIHRARKLENKKEEELNGLG